MAIRELLPAGACVRRDRGQGLYIAPVRIESAHFTSEPAGALWRVYPAEALLCLFEAGEPSSPLERSMARFRGLPIERESLSLFAAAAKLIEAPEPARAQALDRAIRRRAALAMRTGGGGGLYACAAALNKVEVDAL